jgi:hypothetical protein
MSFVWRKKAPRPDPEPRAPLDSAKDRRSLLGLLGFGVAGLGATKLASAATPQYSFTVASIAQMQALPIVGNAAPAAGATCYLGSPSGRAGYFAWTYSNMSTAVANDPGQGINIAPSADTSGASGCWVRQYFGPEFINWFGALGDGVVTQAIPFGIPTIVNPGTDNSTALNNWATWARYQSSLGIQVIVEAQPTTGNAYCFDHSKCQGFLFNISYLRWYSNGTLWQNIYNAGISGGNAYYQNPFGALSLPLFNAASVGQNWFIQQTTVGAKGFSFVTASDYTNVTAGSWYMLGSLDIQYGGFPINVQQHEYVLVTAVNSYAGTLAATATYTSSTGVLSLTFASAPFGAGVGVSLNGIFVTVSGITGGSVNGSWAISSIASAGTVINLAATPGLGSLTLSGGTLAATAIATTDQTIRYQHRPDFPDWAAAGAGFTPCGKGRVWATTTGPYTYTLNLGNVQAPTPTSVTFTTVEWDCDHEYYDLFVGCPLYAVQYWFYMALRRIKTVNFKGVGFSETMSDHVIHEDPKNLQVAETDKLLGSVEYRGGEYLSGTSLVFASASQDRVSLADYKVSGTLQLGACKTFYARNCDIGQLTATGGAGFRSEAIFNACRIFNTQFSVTLLDAIVTRSIDGTNLSFANGIFSVLKSAGTGAGLFGAVPGQTLTLFGPSGVFVGDAGTGVILSVTEDSTYLYVTTSLSGYVTVPQWTLLPGTLTGGSGGTPGSYTSVALTGGSGSGMIATITVGAGGGVAGVSITNFGSGGYLTGDVMSASSGNIGGTTGFSFPLKANMATFADAGYDFIDCTESDRVRSASYAYKKGKKFWEYRIYEFAGNYAAVNEFTAELYGSITKITVTPTQLGSNSSATIQLTFPTYNSASNYAADSGGTIVTLQIGTGGQRVITQGSFAGKTGSDGITVGGGGSSYLPVGRVLSGLWIFHATNNNPGQMFTIEIETDCGIFARRLFPVNAGNVTPPTASVSGTQGMLP